MTERRIVEVDRCLTGLTGVLLHPDYWAAEPEPVHGFVGPYDPRYSSPPEELLASVSDLATRDAQHCSCAVEHLFMLCSCFARPQHAASGSAVDRQLSSQLAAAHDGCEAEALDAQLRFDDGFIRDSRQCSRSENEEAAVATVDDEDETAAIAEDEMRVATVDDEDETAAIAEDEMRVTTVGLDDHEATARGELETPGVSALFDFTLDLRESIEAMDREEAWQHGRA